jgi:hypothetical protein
LKRLHQVIRQGLQQTEPLWPQVREGFDLLKRMAVVLKNEGLHTGSVVRQRFERVLKQMVEAARRARERGQGQLADALEHFVKVSGSYEAGLFHCYDIADLEPTNNDLEQVFGSYRHHERRVSGRKKGSASLVLRGGVRVVAALATRLEAEISTEELAPRDLEMWQQKRAELDKRRETRAQQRRFRRAPDAFLRNLEDKLCQPGLLP